MEKAPEICILCGTGKRELLIQKESWRVYRCLQCGLGFLDPRPSGEEIVKLYGQQYFAEQYDDGLDPETPEFRKRLNQEIHRIRLFNSKKRQGSVLDIGCGNGYFLAACRNRGYEVQGIDISDWAARYATQKLGLTVVTGEIDAIGLPFQGFDVITMWHFLEHMRDPSLIVRKVRNWLKRDGLLVIDVPNYESTDARKNWRNWVGWQLPYHFFHFTPRTLRELLKMHGFRVINSKDYHSETIKMSLKRIPIVSVFARLIAKMYSGTSIAVVAKLES